MHLILPYFIIILILMQIYFKRNNNKTAGSNEDFFKRESEANQSRKRDISNLNYIIIPDNLPFIKTDIAEISNAEQNIKNLKDEKILNLNGKTNTDLKLEYGVANLSELTIYENNFHTLCREIINLAKALIDNGYEKEAVSFLEFGIRSRSDLSANYVMLAEIYSKNGENEKINHLKKYAETLNTITKDYIIKKIDAYLL